MSELEQEVLNLPLKERKQLARIIRKSIVFEENAVCAEDRYDLVKSVVESVTGHMIRDYRRFHNDVIGRIYIAYIMHEDGYTLYEIGSMMDRNHTSVLHLVKTMEAMLSLPGLYKEEIETLKKIQEKLCQHHSEDC